MPLTSKERHAKLRELAEIEGFPSVHALLRASVTDAVCPGICCNPDDPGCHYTVEVEPDAREAYCEACGTQTVKSALILAELI